MASSPFIKFLILLCLGFVGFLYLREPPLPQELAEVKCVSEERKSHAQVSYGNAEVFHLCLGGKMLDKPSEETCHIYNGATVCETEGQIELTRTVDDVVYAASIEELTQMNLLAKEPTDDPDGSYESALFTKFMGQAIKPGAHGDFNEADYALVLRDAKDYLPPDFTLVKGPACYKQATVLDNGYCLLDAKTNSLYWRIILKIRKEKGTEISENDYRRELDFWRPYLTKLVNDPRI